jgi:hypothetical protein
VKHLVAKDLIGEPLGGNEQQVDPVGGNVGLDLVPVVDIA